MKSFAFETFDNGRLTVNREFVPLLETNGLTTFDALMNFAGGQVAKNVLRERTTTRLDLPDESGSVRPFFLKRHRRPPLVEFVKPLLRLQRPILGARNEWDAILRFHQAGIATMLPVALGTAPGCSFLLTAGIEGCRKLTEWIAARSSALHNGELRTLRQIIAEVADVARTMHAAGMHHQDFYLTHLMVPESSSPPRPIHVLDLGRVRWQRTLSRRWIVKDLGQLHYSASRLTASDRLRFLARYLGRPIQAVDRPLVHRILRKSRAIAAHFEQESSLNAAVRIADRRAKWEHAAGESVMNSPDARIHEQAAIGFQRAADAYERGRPEYPAAAVDHLARMLQIAAGSRVVELGAGTGKFTTALASTGASIVAVEPVEGMRRKLVGRLPGLSVVDGTAEAIPLPDASVDAVVAAQAFHWFRGPEALAEIHRVLKPGGGLALIWNSRDESVGWIQRLSQLIEPYEGSAPRYKSFEWKAAFAVTDLFSPLETATFAHVQRIPKEAIEDRVASISFIAALPDSKRAAVLEQVHELIRAEPEIREQVDFRYRTDVYWCRRKSER